MQCASATATAAAPLQPVAAAAAVPEAPHRELAVESICHAFVISALRHKLKAPCVRAMDTAALERLRRTGLLYSRLVPRHICGGNALDVFAWLDRALVPAVKRAVSGTTASELPVVLYLGLAADVPDLLERFRLQHDDILALVAPGEP
jgi:hypothetical protein